MGAGFSRMNDLTIIQTSQVCWGGRGVGEGMGVEGMEGEGRGEGMGVEGRGGGRVGCGACVWWEIEG